MDEAFDPLSHRAGLPGSKGKGIAIHPLIGGICPDQSLSMLSVNAATSELAPSSSRSDT